MQQLVFLRSKTNNLIYIMKLDIDTPLYNDELIEEGLYKLKGIKISDKELEEIDDFYAYFKQNKKSYTFYPFKFHSLFYSSIHNISKEEIMKKLYAVTQEENGQYLFIF